MTRISIAAFTALITLSAAGLAQPAGPNQPTATVKSRVSPQRLETVSGDPKPPKLKAGLAGKVVTGPGGGPRSASGASLAGADAEPKKDPPKDPKSLAGAGGARVSSGFASADPEPKKDPPKDPKSLAGLPGGGIGSGLAAADPEPKKDPPKDPKSLLGRIPDGTSLQAQPNVQPAQVPQPY